jgi:hypothetical protein
MAKPDYDTTLARIAGNIASSLAHRSADGEGWTEDAIARYSVDIARQIVAEVKRTEPEVKP